MSYLPRGFVENFCRAAAVLPLVVSSALAQDTGALGAGPSAAGTARPLPPTVENPADMAGDAPVKSSAAAPSAGSALSYKEVRLRTDPADQSEVGLDIDVVAQARCTFADLDAIMLDLRSSQGAMRLQLNLEPLFAKTTKTIYAKPDDSRRRNATTFGTFSLPVPFAERAVVYGVHICSIPKEQESQNQEPCSKKALIPIEQAMSQYKVDATEALKGGKLQPAPFVQRTNSAPAFKNYFFGYVIAYRDRLIVVDNPLEQKTYGKVLTYLRSVNADVSDYQQLEAHLRQFNGVLTSMPAIARGETLELLLPFYDSKKCIGTN